MSSKEDFLARLEAAALRARGSGFEGTAAAIEDILRAELAREARPAEERDDEQPPLKREP